MLVCSRSDPNVGQPAARKAALMPLTDIQRSIAQLKLPCCVNSNQVHKTLCTYNTKVS